MSQGLTTLTHQYPRSSLGYDQFVRNVYAHVHGRFTTFDGYHRRRVRSHLAPENGSRVAAIPFCDSHHRAQFDVGQRGQLFGVGFCVRHGLFPGIFYQGGGIVEPEGNPRDLVAARAYGRVECLAESREVPYGDLYGITDLVPDDPQFAVVTAVRIARVNRKVGGLDVTCGDPCPLEG